MSNSTYLNARTDNLVTSKVGDETVAYDTEKNKAFCLNGLTTAVWEACDGRTTLAEMTLMLKKSHNLTNEEASAVIEYSLEQLSKAELFRDNPPPAPQRRTPINRRTLLKTLGSMASLPVISSIVIQPALASISADCAACGITCDPTGGNPYLCLNPQSGVCLCLPEPGCPGGAPIRCN